MRSLEFNVCGADQHMVIENGGNGLNPRDSMTVEALCQLSGDGQDPTIFSLPAVESWEPPFVAWRLGFHGQVRIPEFQVTMESDSEPTTVRSRRPIGQKQLVHLAGTYDGSAVRLYVDGKLEAEIAKTGKILRSQQWPTLGARSSTALGGLFVGRLFEMRFWQIARSTNEIDTWKDKGLSLPAPDGLAGLWSVEPSLDSTRAKQLVDQGFSPIEIALVSFVTAYVDAYSSMALNVLSGIAKEQFAHNIHATRIVRAADGYVVLYEPSQFELLDGSGAQAEMAAADGLFLFNWHEYTVSEILQILSENSIKVCVPTDNGAGIEIPKDREGSVGIALNARLKHSGIAPPQIHLIETPVREDGGHYRGRERIVSPLVTLPSGETVRAFRWFFVDIWRGELSWEIAQKGLSDALAVNDLLGINALAGVPLAPPEEVVEVKTHQPLLPLEKVIAEFEVLIGKEDVDEVRDILPFLGKTEHWVILSPTAQQVWPEKMLGNKWRVDFVVKESDGTYIAIEVESPKKRLYKTGQSVDPYAEWTHAEQQVRDYCNFIDMNRDYVEREEGLSGILRPRGLVIIGRRETLSETGKNRLSERNADNGRYQTITFDDLLDQAKAVVERLMALISPQKD